MLHKHRCPGIEKTSTHLQKQALRNLALPVLQDCDFLAAQQTISTAQNYDFVRSGLVAAVLLTRSLRQASWGDVSESTSVEETKEVPGTCEAGAKGRWEGEDRKVRGRREERSLPPLAPGKQPNIAPGPKVSGG